ncbi:hypothetical protein EfmAA96_32710 (plasmid) [Enterococcus faecium]|nr:hypothetical protein EfmAA96_32710 [Enterococcus faecium]
MVFFMNLLNHKKNFMILAKIGEPIVYENTVTDVLINNLPPKEAVYKVINNLYILPADMSFEM